MAVGAPWMAVMRGAAAAAGDRVERGAVTAGVQPAAARRAVGCVAVVGDGGSGRAMTRRSAPPSGDGASATGPARMSRYRAGENFKADGRLTHSWNPWKRPPLVTSHSGGVSMW